jgi:hypothetical protein
MFMDVRARLIKQLTTIKDSPIQQRGKRLTIIFDKHGQSERITLPVNTHNVITEHLLCSSLLCNAFAKGITLHPEFLLNDFEACARAYIRAVKQPDTKSNATAQSTKSNAILKRVIN